MAFNPQQIIQNFGTKFLNAVNPNKTSGGLLLLLNAAGMVFAAISNTFAIAADKNTKPEEKKFLVPAGAVTGAANIGAYYLLTKRIIKTLEKKAEQYTKGLSEEVLSDKTLNYVDKLIKKSAKKGVEYVDSMKTTLLENGNPSAYAKDLFKKNLKDGAGVLGAFTGAVIGCAIITPIIRDISAYVVQRKMKKNNPDLETNYQFIHYIDPLHVQGRNYNRTRQPLSMKSYMASTSGNMKI